MPVLSYGCRTVGSAVGSGGQPQLSLRISRVGRMMSSRQRAAVGDHRVQGLERGRAEVGDRLAHGGELRVQVPCHRDVVETGDGDSAGHLDAVPHQRVDHAERGLVVRTGDRLGQRGPARPAGSRSPGRRRPRCSSPATRAGHELRAVGGRPARRTRRAGQVVRAVRVAAEVGQACGSRGRGPGAGPVRSSRPGCRCPRSRWSGSACPPGSPPAPDGPSRSTCVLVEYPVVQDEPVALAGQAEDPAGVVVPPARPS